MSWNLGESLVCIKSQSCAYTKGKKYEVVKAPNGEELGLIADNGLFDYKSLLLSSFKKCS